MEKWISASEASKLLCCHKEEIYRAERAQQWEHKLGEQPKNGGKRPKLFLVKDVNLLKEHRKYNKRNAGMKSTYYEAIGLVDWADSLAAYPNLDEIKARTTDKYRVPDIVSVIENRTYRGMPELQRTV